MTQPKPVNVNENATQLQLKANNAVMQFQLHAEDEARITKLEKDVAVMQQMINEAIVGGRNMVAFQRKIDSICYLLDEMLRFYNEIVAKLKVLSIDEKYLEIFNDKEIKEWYKQSNLRLQDIQTWFKIMFDEDISLPAVSKYVNAEIKDLIKRSTFGRWLRSESLKHIKAIKEDNQD